jgi:type I restriction enzyme S subunit
MVTTAWKPAKLNELGFVGRGKSRHRPRNAEFLYGGRYPFFQTGDIKAANFHLTKYSQTYSEEGLAQSKLWKPGTLCITIAANIAENAILGIEGCFPDSVVGFVADPDKADVRFVKYYMDILKLRMQNISHGATQDNLSLDKLMTFDFLVPPLPVQRRIAGILSAYDELMENSQRRIQILEQMARSLYREWFIHFRYPGSSCGTGSEPSPAASRHPLPKVEGRSETAQHEKVKRVNSPLGEVPEGWEVVAFTKIADVLSGGTPKTDVAEYWNGEIPFFTPRDTPDCFYVQDTDKHVTGLGLSKCASELYQPDTVFITARGTVGKVALPSVPMAMNQSCYALRGMPGIPQRFLFLMTLQQVDYLQKNTGGATFDTIVVDTFRRMKVVKPTREIIARFARQTDAIFEQVNSLQRQIQNLRRTRDLLLPRLLSGKITGV